MKLYLAVAVLLLALATQSEAQDVEEPTDPSIGQRFNQFGDTVSELGQDLAEKTKNAFQRIHESEFATNSRNWFTETMEKMKAKIDGLRQ